MYHFFKHIFCYILSAAVYMGRNTVYVVHLYLTIWVALFVCESDYSRKQPLFPLMYHCSLDILFHLAWTHSIKLLQRHFHCLPTIMSDIESIEKGYISCGGSRIVVLAVT